MKDLGTLGGNFSEGLGVNNAGQVVGSSQTATGGGDAFLYTSGQRMVALNTLLPSGSGWDSGRPTASTMWDRSRVMA
ncbi:MAG TPA: hypothetical protein VEK84_06395 [Terriglobales bacterium]|nr:hypothetical protein [Terriglobales bacterium]